MYYNPDKFILKVPFKSLELKFTFKIEELELWAKENGFQLIFDDKHFESRIGGIGEAFKVKGYKDGNPTKPTGYIQLGIDPIYIDIPEPEKKDLTVNEEDNF